MLSTEDHRSAPLRLIIAARPSCINHASNLLADSFAAFAVFVQGCHLAQFKLSTLRSVPKKPSFGNMAMFFMLNDVNHSSCSMLSKNPHEHDLDQNNKHGSECDTGLDESESGMKGWRFIFCVGSGTKLVLPFFYDVILWNGIVP